VPRSVETDNSFGSNLLAFNFLERDGSVYNFQEFCVTTVAEIDNGVDEADDEIPLVKTVQRTI
jgi:hypothetical protein